MYNLKRISRLLSHLLLWLLASVLLWSWIFNFLTDTDREYKITLFVGMQSFKSRELAVVLEENLPDEIRMVQIHSFGYALMDSISLQTADLYLMTEAQAREHQDWLCPLPEEMDLPADILQLDGEAVGIPVYSPEKDSGTAASYLNYTEFPDDSWYLCFGQGGYHLVNLENGVDNAAIAVAEHLLAMKPNSSPD